MSPLPYKMNIFANFYTNSPYINGQEETKSWPMFMAGITKQFKNNSSIRIMAYNPFADHVFKSTTTLRGGDIYQKSTYYMDLRNAIMINYTYNFKFGKDINVQKRAGGKETEENGSRMPF